jgi:hypothetical protein
LAVIAYRVALGSGLEKVEATTSQITITDNQKTGRIAKYNIRVIVVLSGNRACLNILTGADTAGSGGEIDALQS